MFSPISRGSCENAGRRATTSSQHFWDIIPIFSWERGNLVFQWWVVLKAVWLGIYNRYNPAFNPPIHFLPDLVDFRSIPLRKILEKNYKP